jgi:hypothetical protein
MARIHSLPRLAPTPWGAAARACLVAAALGLISVPGLAATYKWTDANGRVVYSDQPPNGNFKVEAIGAPPPPANPNAVKELAAKEAEVQQRRLLRAGEETKAAKASLDAESKREQCGKARGQLAMLQSDQNLLYRSNEKGERVLMDGTARRQEREQLEVWFRGNCTS